MSAFAPLHLFLTLALWGLVGCQEPLARRFAVPTDAASRTGAVVDSAGLVIANDAGKIFRLDLAGKVKWTAAVGGEVTARPAVAQGVVVATSSGGEWVGLGLEDGRERWRFADQLSVRVALATDGTRIFALAEQGTLTALDATTGAIAWKWVSSAAAKAPPAPIRVGSSVVTAGDSMLAALDGATGQLRWKVAVAGATGFATDGGHLYVVTRGADLIALDAATGEKTWQVRLPAAATSPPSVAQGAIWVGVAPSALLGFSPSDGALRQRHELPAALRTAVTQSCQLLLVPTSGAEGRLLAFEERKQTAVLDARVDAPLRTPVELLGDTWVVAPLDGRVLGYAQSPPPKN